MSAIVHRYDASTAYDLVGLRYVRTIAACGSMTAAARELRVSQPTLSVAVKELETRLGTTLFLRGPTGMVPTASGRALVRASEEVFALLRQADEEVRGVESVVAGRFVVGCYHSFGAFFLPGLMRGLARRAPRIELALWEGTGPQVRDAVVDRTVHFAVDAGLGPRPHPDLVIVPMFRDLIGVVCARRRPPAVAPLFYVPRIPSCQKVVDGLRERGKLPERVVPCGDLELVKSLVLHGTGTGVLPWRVASYGAPRGALRLLDAALPYEVDVGSLLYRADLHRTRAAVSVRDEIVARGRELDAIEMPVKVGRVGKDGAVSGSSSSGRGPRTVDLARASR
jgi:DNA-binding transcriptional LysR family regulator